MSSEPRTVGYCRACGKALDETTVRSANGTIYCAEHAPAPRIDEASASQSHTALPYHSSASPYSSPYASSAHRTSTAAGQPPPLPNGHAASQGGSPALAFLLGMIPGVGAIYNGQYAKGLIHVIIVGVMIGILDNNQAGSLEPLFGLMLTGFWFYMAFEAYHTAKRRKLGQPIDEFSGLTPMGERQARLPIGPVVLIAVGILFLLNNLGLLDIHKAARYWPTALIVYGAYLLWVRTRPVSPNTGEPFAPADIPVKSTDMDSAESRML
jgi:hypothetical protein